MVTNSMGVKSKLIPSDPISSALAAHEVYMSERIAPRETIHPKAEISSCHWWSRHEYTTWEAPEILGASNVVQRRMCTRCKIQKIRCAYKML